MGQMLLSLVVIWGGFLYGYVAIKASDQARDHAVGTAELPAYPRAVYTQTFTDS